MTLLGNGDGETRALLRQTVAVAEAALARGDSPFGAAIVIAGRVVSLEANATSSSLDPSAHAEICAIRSACQTLNRENLTGAVLYSSCEPCMMCAAAAVWAGIDSVVYAAPIEALTLFPITSLFPPGSFDWAQLPLGRTLEPLDDAAELLSRGTG